MDKQPILDLKAMGERLRQKRHQLNLTQAQVAERIGISEAYYGRLECGTRALSVECLLRVACFYDVSLDYLMMDSNHIDNGSKLTAEIENILRDKSPMQSELLLGLLKIHARSIDELMH